MGIKMGSYSDEFFKEYEAKFADSDRDDPTLEQRPVSRIDRFPDSAYERGAGERRVHRDVNRRPTRPDRAVSHPSNRPRPNDPQNGARRPRPSRRKKRKSRLFRRTMIVLSFAGILLLLIGIIAIAVSASGVGEPKELAVSSVAADQVVLSWGKANHATGYRIFAAKGSDSMTPMQTIDNPETLTATISGLDQATAYSFSVVALRGQKEGKPVLLSSITTLPQTPEITNSYSAKKGSIHLDWAQNDKASGYLVEYKKDGADYSADTTVTISDPAECRADITGLEENATYTARVSSFVSGDSQLKSAPSAEVSLKVAAEDTEVVPKAKELKVDGSIDPNKPMIALTFDDGPAVDRDCGDRILDTLEQYNAKATFFMLGCNAGEATENLKRKVRLGMEIGNHTWNHKHYGGEVTPEDIRKGSNGIYEVCGEYPTAFRSPGGMTTDTILNECATEGMSAYYWSIDTQDWSSRDAEAVYHAVIDNVKDGDIVLMHEIYDSTADAVAKMVPELIDKGFQLVTCHDLIAVKGGAAPVPGKEYVDAFREMTR